jgi:hypothetical protein
MKLRSQGSHISNIFQYLVGSVRNQYFNIFPILAGILGNSPEYHTCREAKPSFWRSLAPTQTLASGAKRSLLDAYGHMSRGPTTRPAGRNMDVPTDQRPVVTLLYCGLVSGCGWPWRRSGKLVTWSDLHSNSPTRHFTVHPHITKLNDCGRWAGLGYKIMLRHFTPDTRSWHERDHTQ